MARTLYVEHYDDNRVIDFSNLEKLSPYPIVMYSLLIRKKVMKGITDRSTNRNKFDRRP